MSLEYITIEHAGGNSRPGIRARRARRARAFTLIELCIAIAIIGVITLIAVPGYSAHVEQARVSQAVADILEMNLMLERYYSDHYSHPDDLSAIASAGKLDPWGRPYQYLNLETAGNIGKARKNKKLVPINSDYDLYSTGKDGKSSSPLTAKNSQDDVVRANDGRFVGLASTYGK